MHAFENQFDRACASAMTPCAHARHLRFVRVMGKKIRQLNVRLDDETYAQFEDWRAARRPIPLPTSAARTLLRRGAAVELHLAAILSEALPDLLQRGLLSTNADQEFYTRLGKMVCNALDAAMATDAAAPEPISLAARRNHRSASGQDS